MVVIGGGVVGSYVAYKLAGLGHRAVVLERHKQVGDRVCCTGIISQECIRSFGLDESVVLRGVNSARLFSPSGELLRLWRETTQASIIDRPALDRAMANRAQGEGAEYLLSSLTTDVEVRESGVIVKARCQKERMSLEARVAVVATGFSPKFTERLGLGRVADFVIGGSRI